MSRISIQCEQCFDQFEVASSTTRTKYKCPACGAINRADSSSATKEPPRVRAAKKPETDKPVAKPRQAGAKRRQEKQKAIPWFLVLSIGAASMLLVGLIDTTFPLTPDSLIFELTTVAVGASSDFVPSSAVK